MNGKKLDKLEMAIKNAIKIEGTDRIKEYIEGNLILLDEYDISDEGDDSPRDHMETLQDCLVSASNEYGKKHVSQITTSILNKPYTGHDVRDIHQIRVFSLKNRLQCFECKEIHSTQDLIQEAFSNHFNSMENENCENCDLRNR